MEFSVASKDLITQINQVIGTTGAANINLEVGGKNRLHLKSSNKGSARHFLTDIQVENVGKDFVGATIPASQFIGILNRRGDVKIRIGESDVMVSGRNYKASLNIPPFIEVDAIKSSSNTLNLTGQTLFEIDRHIPGLELSNLYSTEDLFLRVSNTKGVLHLLISDNFRLVSYSIPNTEQEDFQFDITLGDLRSLLEIVLDNPDAEFSVEDSRIYARDKTTAISYPKRQPGSMLPINRLLALKDVILKKKGVETLGGIDLPSLILEVDGCKNIAAEKTTVDLTARGEEFMLSYVTPHGRIKTKGACTNGFLEGSCFMFDPFLFSDFLNSLSMFDTVDLRFIIEEKRVYSYLKEKSGYEAFHLCAGH